MEEAKSTISQSLLLKSGNKHLKIVKDLNYQQMNILAMSFKNHKQTKKLKQEAPKMIDPSNIKSKSINKSKQSASTSYSRNNSKSKIKSN